MKNIKYQIIMLSFIVLNIVFPNIDFSEEQVKINIIEENNDFIIVEYKINNFDIGIVETSNEIFHQLSLHKEPNFITAEKPSLPHINRSFIIPDNHSIDVSIIEQEYDVYQNINIAPSKGNLKRNIDINLVPYKKGESYNKDEYFPGHLYSLHDPYILRDFRGQVVQINPFQFNPSTSTLKVYNRILVKIEFIGNNEKKNYE